jgi:hypothetical protein
MQNGTLPSVQKLAKTSVTTGSQRRPGLPRLSFESSNANYLWMLQEVIIKHEPPPQPENFRLLPVGRLGFAYVDPDVFQWAICYHWRLLKSSHCIYVARRIVLSGHTLTIRLHVDIMSPPLGYEVHHIDRNPLNCLRSNLQNVTPTEHRQLHGKAC